MKIFCVRTLGYKTAVEFITVEEYRRFVDLLGDKLERIWVEVREVTK